MTVDKEETNIGAHAILISNVGTSDLKSLLLQQRDNNPEIINPGLISMFGGTLKKNDDVQHGLIRELKEELELNIEIKDLRKLGVFYKTKELDGIDYTIHVFIIEDIDPSKLKLHEGKSIYNATLEECLKNQKLTRITRLALEAYNKSINN